MHIIVVTGGLGAGKSTAAEYFRGRGAAVLCLDSVAHSLMAPGTDLLGRVVEAFGAEVLTADGSLDRPALARKAFAAPDSAERLNAIVHPAVAAEVGPALQDLRLLPEPPQVVVIEVPLLVEAPVFAELADQVLAIEAPEETRLERAVARGMNADEARRRIDAQATDVQRAGLADAVVSNDGSADEFQAALDRFWSERVAVPHQR